MRIVLRQCGMLLATALLSVPSFAFAAAELSFSPESGSYGVGKTFTVNIVVDSGADKFNSANAQISFDKDLLSVQSVSKTSSAFSLWAVEPSSSNAQGTVNFEGGNTSPLSGKKTLLSVTFKGLKEGKASVRFASASVLAADGKGTDISGTKKEASFDISASATESDPAPAPPAATPSSLDVPVPEAPVIQSPTHPDEQKWSNAPKAKFTWELLDDVTALRLAFDTKEKTVPTTSYDPPIPDREFETLTNGTMYFHLRFRNEGGWGPTTHRKILVDTAPPEQFDLTATVDASSTGVVLLTFVATDTLSGIDRYEILVDGGNPTKLARADLKPEGYKLANVPGGERTITVKAYDKAGNSTDAEAKATVPEAPPPAAPVEEEEEKPLDWGLIRQVMLVAIVAFLIGYLIYERRAFAHEKYLAKREADELRDEMASVIAALREEVGEQVGSLFQKPNPSARDREVMEKINEAVDLSEEILAKEVEDVRKYLM